MFSIKTCPGSCNRVRQLKQLCIDRFWQEELWTESKHWQALVEEDHSKLSSWISIDFHNCMRNSLPIPRGHDFTLLVP